MPKISVIVPIYNVEQYLPRCIDSILNQTFSDLELILVDDGSPDSCGKICDDYAEKDSRVKVLHKENAGVCAARNSALDIACGKYVTFCDSDDYYKEQWLEYLVTEIEKNNADSVAGSFVKADDDGEMPNKIIHASGLVNADTPEQKFDFACDILSGKYGWEIWTRLFKLDIINENKIRFCTTCGNFAEDMAFVLEYSLYANVFVSIDFAGYCYYIRRGSMMQNSKNVTKLDELNEVSHYYNRSFEKVFEQTNVGKLYPVIHYLIMKNQYDKLTLNNEYHRLGEELEKIQNRKFHKEQTKKIYSLKKYLKEKFGKDVMARIILFSRYCCHGNYKRYGIESAIFYKFFN